jgi:hypothetical protein
MHVTEWLEGVSVYVIVFISTGALPDLPCSCGMCWSSGGVLGVAVQESAIWLLLLLLAAVQQRQHG